jgi:hypothetical protein
MSIRTERDENNCEFQFAKLKNNSRVPILYSSESPLLRKEGKTCSHTQVFAITASGKRTMRVRWNYSQLSARRLSFAISLQKNLHTGFPIKHTAVIGKKCYHRYEGIATFNIPQKFKILHLSLLGVLCPKERKSHMNTAISTLVIPQEATELTLNELKLICGGWDDNDCGCKKPRPKLELEKVIKIKVFKVKKRKKPSCDGDDGSDDN